LVNSDDERDMSAPLALLNLQAALASAGFARSAIFGGPRDGRQAVAVVLGELSRVPADGYAVACRQEAWRAGMDPERLLELPRMERLGMKDQLAAASRGLIRLFQEADGRGMTSLALPVPETRAFGELGDGIAVRVVLAAAETFWTVHCKSGLNHVLVAVPAERLVLEIY
jgi:preprotein translocase subunit Sec61beta